MTDNVNRSVLDGLSPRLKTCIDAAAYAWINAGGGRGMDGSYSVEDWCTEIQNRIEELESEETP